MISDLGVEVSRIDADTYSFKAAGVLADKIYNPEFLKKAMIAERLCDACRPPAGTIQEISHTQARRRQDWKEKNGHPYNRPSEAGSNC
jgi:hypothetical protein